ncbi:hypothetical protein SAMN05216480_11178 [Pustulibacterium marinum]|uniref:Tetratricopeptide repeat-containing protein n=1 Tax=Pustulibacterium marinum TaxID=1224947 RepID=A0A1I7HWA1_9FLAO|nr:hypothetical protein [Pustulibacterium marinum]SFU64921.1 hypothetical protein SAMN05216480_11178 [Pustulibacterium marinum]
MKLLFTLCFAFVSVIGFSQSYEKGMEKAFALWQEGKATEASNMFERISAVETENWIPLYYVAYVNIIDAFSEKDKTRLQLKLDKAKTSLEKAKQLSPDNVEILIMEAMHNTAWIAFDGATYGMKYGAVNTAIYQKATAMAPENPRVALSSAEWNMGMAQYFGKDTAPYCKDIEKALELFTTFKNETPFYPSWGEGRAKEVLASCK